MIVSPSISKLGSILSNHLGKYQADLPSKVITAGTNRQSHDKGIEQNADCQGQSHLLDRRIMGDESLFSHRRYAQILRAFG